MAANECEKLLQPKYNRVCTKTSIFRGLNRLSLLSSSMAGFGNSFSTAITSSGEHFDLIFVMS